MTANTRQRLAPASLTVQVMQAELRVLHDRQLLVSRASMFGRNMRSRLTSPSMLLLAAGVGLAVGHFTWRPAPARGKIKQPSVSKNKLFARVLKVVAFARTLWTAFPSAAKDPSLPTNFSGQEAAPQAPAAAL